MRRISETTRAPRCDRGWSFVLVPGRLMCTHVGLCNSLPSLEYSGEERLSVRTPALVPRATGKDQRGLVWQGLVKQVSVEVRWAFSGQETHSHCPRGRAGALKEIGLPWNTDYKQRPAWG